MARHGGGHERLIKLLLCVVVQGDDRKGSPTILSRPQGDPQIEAGPMRFLIPCDLASHEMHLGFLRPCDLNCGCLLVRFPPPLPPGRIINPLTRMPDDDAIASPSSEALHPSRRRVLLRAQPPFYNTAPYHSSSSSMSPIGILGVTVSSCAVAYSVIRSSFWIGRKLRRFSRRSQHNGGGNADSTDDPPWSVSRHTKNSLNTRLEMSKLVKTFVLADEKRVGIEVHVTNAGAAVTKLLWRDADGVVEDVVLGHDNPLMYLDNTCNAPYFGVVVGRVANRIANGEFTLDGKQYKLVKNDNGRNHLHGGKRGFDRQVWSVVGTPTSNKVKLRHTSKDGEEGYPGNVEVTVEYALAEGELAVTFEAFEASQPTPINLASHSYFNLNGHTLAAAAHVAGDARNGMLETVLNHAVSVSADSYTPVDEHLIPTGEVASVSSTPFDLRHLTKLAERIPHSIDGYDHNFVLDVEASRQGKLSHAATVKANKRRIDLFTTAPGVQLYTGNFLDANHTMGKRGVKYPRHGGLCLETQNFPNAVNESSFPNAILKPGEKYVHRMLYKFSNEL